MKVKEGQKVAVIFYVLQLGEQVPVCKGQSVDENVTRIENLNRICQMVTCCN